MQSPRSGIPFRIDREMHLNSWPADSRPGSPPTAQPSVYQHWAACKLQSVPHSGLRHLRRSPNEFPCAIDTFLQLGQDAGGEPKPHHLWLIAALGIHGQHAIAGRRIAEQARRLEHNHQFTNTGLTKSGRRASYRVCPIRACATCVGAQTNSHAPVTPAFNLDRTPGESPNLIISGYERRWEFTGNTKRTKVASGGL